MLGLESDEAGLLLGSHLGKVLLRDGGDDVVLVLDGKRLAVRDGLDPRLVVVDVPLAVNRRRRLLDDVRFDDWRSRQKGGQERFRERVVCMGNSSGPADLYGNWQHPPSWTTGSAVSVQISVESGLAWVERNS